MQRTTNKTPVSRLTPATTEKKSSTARRKKGARAREDAAVPEGSVRQVREKTGSTSLKPGGRVRSANRASHAGNVSQAEGLDPTATLQHQVAKAQALALARECVISGAAPDDGMIAVRALVGDERAEQYYEDARTRVLRKLYIHLR